MHYSFQDYSKIRWNYVKCPKCSGERGQSGRIRRYKHVDNGKCFLCNGKGEIARELAIEEHTKWLRIYFKESEYPNYTYKQLVNAYDKMVEEEMKEMGWDDLL